MSLEETGYPELLQIYSYLRSTGQDPVVVDTNVLRQDPRGVLAALCAAVGIEFTDVMLSWAAGPKDFDGLWASHWYKRYHESTGFEPPGLPSPLPVKLFPLLEECYPLYDMLRRKAIGGLSLDRLWPATVSDHGLALPALPDERNQHILVWVGGRLVPRAYASMSVFDSTVQVRWSKHMNSCPWGKHRNRKFKKEEGKTHR